MLVDMANLTTGSCSAACAATDENWAASTKARQGGIVT
jgi:hypothetical protein